LQHSFIKAHLYHKIQYHKLSLDFVI